MLFIIILVIAFILFMRTRFYDEKVLTVYFGLPGAGKSTFAAHLAKECLKESFVVRFMRSHCDKYPIFNKWLDTGHIGPFNLRIATPVYSNVPIRGAYEVDAPLDVGFHMINNGKLIIDEAGIEYNNRSYKTMSKEAIKWFKLHRHYHMSVDVFSQSFEDMDITLRRLAYRYFLVTKSIIPNFIACRRIVRRIGIDPLSHQVVDQYEFAMFGTKHIYAPKYYNMFDSYDAPELPTKEWQTYTAEQVEEAEQAEQYDEIIQENKPESGNLSLVQHLKLAACQLFDKLHTFRRQPDPDEDLAEDDSAESDQDLDRSSLLLDISLDDILTPEEDRIFGRPLEEISETEQINGDIAL